MEGGLGWRRNLRSSERRNYHWQWHWYGSRYYVCKDVKKCLVYLYYTITNSNIEKYRIKSLYCHLTICHLHQFEGLYQPSGIQSTWTSEGLLVLSADTNPDPDSWQLTGETALSLDPDILIANITAQPACTRRINHPELWCGANFTSCKDFILHKLCVMRRWI